MTHIVSAVAAQATFGRDGAMFEGLLGFVAQLSWVLWGLVIVTTVIRFVGIRIYRRGTAGTAPVGTVAPSLETVAPGAAVAATAVPATAVPATMAAIDLVQPAAGQLTDAGPARLGLSGSTAAEKDAVLVPAGHAPAAVAASVKVPRRATRNRRAEPRSASHVHALASNSTEA